MEKPGLLSLSDEVLLHIFSYLDGIDKINTFRTCVRFSNVLCDRTLARKLKLIGDYSVTAKEIKCYLKPKMMQQNIQVLDITSCYWLQPSEVCEAVLSLKSLVAFYSVDVKFTFNQIVRIVNKFPELKYLSFSWPALSSPKDLADNSLNSLVFLYIYFSELYNTNWFMVVFLICKCNSLKQLWLISPGNDPRSIIATADRFSSRQFALDTLVITGLQNEYILQHLRDVLTISVISCKCLWLPINTYAWSDYFQTNTALSAWQKHMESMAHKELRLNVRKNGKLRRYYWAVSELPFFPGDEQYEDLEELKIEYCFSLGLLQPLQMLTVLCIPHCVFSGPEGKLREEVELLPKWCPEIQHFELHLCKPCFKDHGRQDNRGVLEMIAEWPKLRTLNLKDCWHLRCGKDFDKIFTSCKNLKKLFLRNLGAQYGYVFQFTKALRNCKNLKDFRFEDTSVTHAQVRALFEALAELPLIERVVFEFQTNSKCPNEALVLDFIEKSPKLVFFCIISPYMPQSQTKRLMKTITEQFIPMRPALRCYFVNSLENSEKNKFPAVHLYEMVQPELSGPFELPYRKDFFFEVSHLDVAANENAL